jgi:hypothetical protein
MAVLNEETPTIRKFWVLIGTLALAVLLSFLFIKLIILLDMKDYLALVIPLLPVFYTIVYPILDRPFSNETRRKVQRGAIPPIEIASPAYFRNLSVWRIAGALAISAGIKFLMEMTYFTMLLFLSKASLSSFWMGLDPATLFRLARGDLASAPLPFLFFEMMMMALAGGVWLGAASKTRPVMEGIVAGTILSVVLAFTNLIPLFGKIKTMTSSITRLSAEGRSMELLSGILFFTFVFNCWVLVGMTVRRSGLNRKTRR